MKALRSAALFLCVIATPMHAATDEELDRLHALVGIPELIETMRDEGIEQANELASDMFADAGNAAWDRVLAGIYDLETMSETVRDGFDNTLRDVDISPLLDFYESERARQIVDLELTARRALGDEDVESAAEDALAKMRREGDPRLISLEAFVVANDLVELNVAGGLNSNLSFYEGMADGGLPMTSDDIVAEVWLQEPEIRAETETWIYAYLAMAYEPLSEETLFAYTDVTRSPAGQALNKAMFDSFDAMYRNISYALGRAAAEFGQGEEL